jgi:uncharacterized protein (TIGR03437 family)
MRLQSRTCTFAAAAAIFCARAFGAPTINVVANAASNIGFNYPIAQGAIFVIYGNGLGPANIAIASAAFQNTNVGGTSVAVTVGGTTVNALMYYASATQVAALLPSNTPTGSGSFTVTYNGQTSTPVTHGVGPNNLGIFTVDSSGQGAAVVTYPDYSLVSPVKAANCGGPSTTCGAANPGDILILWGTGLGAVNGSDAAGAGLGVNMPNIPLTVWLGGVQAPVVYQGRSGCCIGEDQIVFTIPASAPTGCAVPLTVQIGTNTSTVSNTGLIAVANGSRSCTPVDPELVALSSSTVQQLVTSGNPVTAATLEVRKEPNSSGTGFVDTAKFQAFKFTLAPGTQPFFLSYVDQAPIGTCVVYSNPNDNNDFPLAAASDLSAGTSVSLKGQNGTFSVAAAPINANGGRVTLSANGSFLVPGSYTVTGPGGTDIGAFTANFSMAALPNLTSPTANATVTRANGLTVTWTPGASGTVGVQVVSGTDNNFSNGFTTDCSAPASAGTLTIPAYALLPHIPNSPSYLEFYSTTIIPVTASGANYTAVQTDLYGPGVGITLK